MVASAVLLLVHVPPAPASDREVVAPTQAFSVPPIAAGSGLIVTTAVAEQVVLVVYVIVVVPAETAVTRPLLATVATAVLLLVHDIVGVVASLSIVVLPAQADNTPVIAAGSGLIEIAFVTTQPMAVV